MKDAFLGLNNTFVSSQTGVEILLPLTLRPSNPSIFVHLIKQILEESTEWLLNRKLCRRLTGSDLWKCSINLRNLRSFQRALFYKNHVKSLVSSLFRKHLSPLRSATIGFSCNSIATNLCKRNILVGKEILLPCRVSALQLWVFLLTIDLEPDLIKDVSGVDNQLHI